MPTTWKVQYGLSRSSLPHLIILAAHELMIVQQPLMCFSSGSPHGSKNTLAFTKSAESTLRLAQFLVSSR